MTPSLAALGPAPRPRPGEAEVVIIIIIIASSYSGVGIAAMLQWSGSPRSPQKARFKAAASTQYYYTRIIT
jgi:hypothetical protein